MLAGGELSVSRCSDVTGVAAFVVAPNANSSTARETFVNVIQHLVACRQESSPGLDAASITAMEKQHQIE
jgi:hypothetical protein